MAEKPILNSGWTAGDDDMKNPREHIDSRTVIITASESPLAEHRQGTKGSFVDQSSAGLSNIKGRQSALKKLKPPKQPSSNF